MGEESRPRVPIKAGFFTIPEDRAQPPKLLGTVCETCGEYFYPQRTICAKCLSDRTRHVELDARGTLYSYTFVHMPLFGSHNVEHAEGYGVGQIDLPEGPRVQAPLAGKQAEFRVGLPVQGELDLLRTNDAGQDVVIVRFRPMGGAA